jgi:lipopolysaccharide export LptBFGC system permease protein LptF
MPTKHTAIVIAFVAVILTGIALPDSTNAYTPIEQFYGAGYDRISTRDADFRKQQQDETSRERREAEQKIIFTAQKPIIADERALVRTQADENQKASEVSSTDIINALTQLLQATGNTESSQEARRNARLVERLTLHAGAPLGQQYGYAGQGIQQGPLTQTGAGTVIAMMALFATGIWTVRRSSKNPACR